MSSIQNIFTILNMSTILFKPSTMNFSFCPLNTTTSVIRYVSDHESNQTLTRTLIALLPLTFIIDALCLLTIIKSRLAIVKVEFYILIVIQLIALAYKLFSITISFGILSRTFVFGHLTCIYLYPGFFSASTSFNTILIYYSIFHLSIIKRTQFYLQLFELVRTVKCFVIYSITTVSVITIYFYVFRTDVLVEYNNGTRSRCRLNTTNSKTIAIVVTSNSPLFFVLLVYFFFGFENVA